MRTLACALVTGALLSGAAEHPSDSYAIAQTAIVQLGDWPRLYLARPDSGLESVDLRTGRVLWRTKQAVFPIIVREDRLLALMPVPPRTFGWRLAVLSTSSGRIISRLPVWGQEGWEGTVGGGMGSTTTMSGVSKDGRDFVVWHLRVTPVSGARLNNPRPGYTKTGAAQVDLARGTLVPVTEEFPNSDDPLQMDREGGYRLGPFAVAGVAAVAAVERHGSRMGITLSRTRGAETLPDVVLCDVPWNSAGVSVSVDRLNVVGACQDPGQTRSSRSDYDLVVHSMVTGARVGHVMSDAFPGTWLLWKDKLVFFVPERVVVEDLSRGRRLFQRPLRTLTYLGPYPPRAAPPRP